MVNIRTSFNTDNSHGSSNHEKSVHFKVAADAQKCLEEIKVLVSLHSILINHLKQEPLFLTFFTYSLTYWVSGVIVFLIRYFYLKEFVLCYLFFLSVYSFVWCSVRLFVIASLLWTVCPCLNLKGFLWVTYVCGHNQKTFLYYYLITLFRSEIIPQCKTLVVQAEYSE